MAVARRGCPAVEAQLWRCANHRRHTCGCGDVPDSLYPNESDGGQREVDVHGGTEFAEHATVVIALARAVHRHRVRVRAPMRAD
jgi:hypothetical protein